MVCRAMLHKKINRPR